VSGERFCVAGRDASRGGGTLAFAHMKEGPDAMRDLFTAGKFLLLDLASTIVFLVVLAITHSVAAGVILGIAFGVSQIGWLVWRRSPIDTMHWMSLFLVLASGGATLLTNDPRFVMFKPTVIYLIVAVVMLKRGWMKRYMPAIAVRTVPDLMVFFGYVWSAMMFGSALLNVALLFTLTPEAWAAAMSVWGIASKLVLFAIQFTIMRIVGGRRGRTLLSQEELAAYSAGRPLPSAAEPAAAA
jgi:intracellular septation protein